MLTMQFKPKLPARAFRVGLNNIEITDTGTMYLDADEQITFSCERGSEYDVCRKDWGYYATPSVNGRLKNFGFKTAFVRNITRDMRYVMLVEEAKMSEFLQYLDYEGLEIISWLDE